MNRDQLDVVPATIDHAVLMAPYLRKIDCAEMWAQCAWTAEDGLTFSVTNSEEAYAVIEEGNPVPILMFGISKSKNILDGKRVIWLLGTDRMDDIKGHFVRECASYMNLMASGKTVYNYVMAENVTALRWLRWLGFTIAKTEPHGWLKKPFHYVERTIPCVLTQQQQQRPA